MLFCLAVFTVVQYPANATIIQSDTAQFTCAVTGTSRTPNLSFRRNHFVILQEPDKYIISNNNSGGNFTLFSTLTIINTTPSDSGSYFCYIFDDQEEISLLFTLNVVAVPTVSLEMSSYFVDESDSVTFQCTSTGVPEPVIYWYRNGSLLNDTSRFIASQNETFNSSAMIYSITGSLMLIDALVTDSGNDYSCVATNSVGSSAVIFSLTVYCKYVSFLILLIL